MWQSAVKLIDRGQWPRWSRQRRAKKGFIEALVHPRWSRGKTVEAQMQGAGLDLGKRRHWVYFLVRDRCMATSGKKY